MSYDYFYGQSGELFSYFRIPKALFQDHRFRQLSTDARTLYGILLDRMSLSVKNGWLDEQGRVYIIYTVREVQESLCCAEHKAIKLFRELEDMDLIERKRRGLGRPSLIYVKDFSSGLPKAQVQNCPNSNSGAAESAILEQLKPQASNTDKNKTEWNDPDPIYSGGIREQLEDYFYQSLEVDLLLRLCPDDEDTIYQIVDLLVDTCSTKRKMLRIAGDDKPTEVVRSRLKKLNADHIRFVLDSLAENTAPVRNMKQYLLAIHKSYYTAARSGTAAQTAGGKAASNGASAARSGVEQAVEKGKTAVSTAVKGLANAAKSNAHVLVIVGVFLLLILMVMSGFSSCGILFSGGTQVSGQTMYSAEDRDIRGAEQDYKKLEKELDKKIKRTPTDHPGYNEYQYHLDPIEHDPWQLTSFLTTLYDDYTRSEVQGKLKETFKKQYKLTTWVEVQIRYKTVWVISPAGIPVPTQVPYEYRIFHTKLVNRGLEVVIREELNNDQWKRYEIFQDTLGGRPYLFNGGLPPGGSDGSGTPGIDYQVPAEALTDEEFAAIYKEAQKYVGTPYVWGGSTPETGFDCSGYVCWVYNQNGYDVGRTTANGLWNKSQHISEAEAKPGDLVFFKGTYDTPGMSHTGIYLGNGMMVSAGDPIKYANIHSSYWEKHLAGFGRLSK